MGYCQGVLYIALCAAAFVQVTEAFSLTINVRTTRLPDPGPLNRFLRENASQPNPLVPLHPPLQLQLCNASVYDNLFDIYTIEHPEGCATAPLMVRPGQDHRRQGLAVFEQVCSVWALITLGLLAMLLVGVCIGGSEFRAYVGDLLKPRLVKELNAGVRSGTAVKCGNMKQWFVVFWYTVPFALTQAVPPIYVALAKQTAAILVPLPDPAIFNTTLASTDLNLTLTRCTIRDIFQVYVGFSDGCDQLQDSIYPTAKHASSRPLNHGVAMSIWLNVAVIIASVSWWMIAMWALYHVSRCVVATHRKLKKVWGRSDTGGDVEMQAPASSGV